jgi:hypothetical protein
MASTNEIRHRIAARPLSPRRRRVRSAEFISDDRKIKSQRQNTPTFSGEVRAYGKH